MKAILKLKQIIADRYGKSLQVKRLSSINNYDLESSYQIVNNQIHIPIYLNDCTLGFGIIDSMTGLDQKDADDLVNLVKLILTPALYNEYLERKEDNIRSSKELVSQGSTNIFSLQTMYLQNESEKPEKPRFIEKLIYLHSFNSTLVQKAAHELHDLSKNWAFIHYSNLISKSPEKQISTQDILKIADSTIFIEKFDYLSNESKEQIKATRKLQSEDSPIIIVSSNDFENKELFDLDKVPLNSLTLRHVLELYYIDTWSSKMNF